MPSEFELITTIIAIKSIATAFAITTTATALIKSLLRAVTFFEPDAIAVKVITVIIRDPMFRSFATVIEAVELAKSVATITAALTMSWE